MEVTDTIYKNFYGDDCLKSLPTQEDAQQLVADLADICVKGGFQLVKWTSNSRKVLSSIPEAPLTLLPKMLLQEMCRKKHVVG